MKVWTDKKGEKLTTKEFVERMGEGIKEITPLQQTTTQINSTWVMIIGLLGGVVITIKSFKSLWWLTLILAAGLINTGISQLGLLQKRKTLRKMEEVYDSAEEPDQLELGDAEQILEDEVIDEKIIDNSQLNKQEVNENV